MMELMERNLLWSGFCLLAELYLVQDGRWGLRELSELGFEVRFCKEQPMLSNVLPGPIHHLWHQWGGVTIPPNWQKMTAKEDLFQYLPDPNTTWLNLLA